MQSAELRELITAADSRIRRHVQVTPLIRATDLEDSTGGEVWLKLECRQRTGAFKLRGAANCLLAAAEAGPLAAVVTASTGNHGAAVVHMARQLDVAVTVVAPNHVTAMKRERLERGGAEVILRGDDCVLAEAHARELAAARGVPFVSPYNDALVVAGQGSLGVELSEQIDGADAVLVPVGGGGLISGIAAWLEQAWPQAAIVGCQPAASAVMAASVTAGRIVEGTSRPTLSDATAGGIEAGSITFELCRQLVTRWSLVDEMALAAAIRHHATTHHELVEGAGALPLAALLSEPERYRDRRVVLVLSGGNLSAEAQRRVLGIGAHTS